MDWKESARARLGDHLDAQGDLSPPWEEFPTYERYSLGWRMGSGEDWIGLWGVFLEGLGEDEEERQAYLRRHRPAPATWASSVWRVLHPAQEQPDEMSKAHLTMLYEQGFIGDDVACETWLLAQADDWTWPWTHSETPSDAARYWTRDLWFWGRRVHQVREREGHFDAHRHTGIVDDTWAAMMNVLDTGTLTPGDVEPEQGLWSLAMMCAANDVRPPWALGCQLESFEDSFEMDMHYVDAYRLWCMSAFDDRATAHASIGEVPDVWRDWVEDEVFGMLT